MAPRFDIDATINTYGNYGKNQVTGSDRNHPSNVVGPIGKWNKAYAVTAGLNEYTGSRAGISGINVLTHGSAVIHLSGGGTVPAAQLESDNGVIQELGIKRITGASSAVITVYKRRADS
tara:strand:- start:492 stop:848 length:357 start_codon:yes stop_codon:yes gene_type:complete